MTGYVESGLGLGLGLRTSPRQDLDRTQHPGSGVVGTTINKRYTGARRAINVTPAHGHLAEVEAMVIEKPRRRGHRRDRREYIKHDARRDNAGNRNESARR